MTKTQGDCILILNFALSSARMNIRSDGFFTFPPKADFCQLALPAGGSAGTAPAVEIFAFLHYL